MQKATFLIYLPPMKDLKISIIIPIYNVEAYIEDCLRSVASQTYEGPIECLLIDDCGTDRSMAIAQRFMASYHGAIEFRLIRHEHNRGLSAARNTGTEEATGSYVYFLDSDDEMDKHCLEMLARPLEEKAYDIVVGGYKATGKGSEAPALHLADGTILEGSAIMESYVRGDWYVMAWNKLCNLQFLRHNHIFFKEGLLHEDELWSFMVACQAKSLRIGSHPCYIYKLREGSIMVNDKAKQRRILTMTCIVEYMTDYLLKAHITSPIAATLIIEKTYVDVWHELMHLHASANDTVTYCNKCREQIARIPYTTRVKACCLGAKQAIRYFGSLLPKRLFVPYLRVLDHIYKLKK